jgi:rare lipoprotein A
MTDNSLIALSSGAAAQLGAAANAPVRVRRVNPPENERATLRLGGQAPDRLETPETLLAVLRRKLPAEGSSPLAQAVLAPEAVPVALASADAQASAIPKPAASHVPDPSAANQAARTVAAAAAPKPATAPRASPATTPNGAYVVQAGAFSSEDRARTVAKAIGGSVTRAGALFRVRTGPFGSRTQAEASLAKVRAAGYSDARIFTNG